MTLVTVWQRQSDRPTGEACAVIEDSSQQHAETSRFTRQAAPDWIGDRRWIRDIRRKEQMLVKVVTLEVTISGKQAQYLGNRPRTCA